MPEQSRSRKVQEWSQRLLRFSQSSQTVVEFCRSEGVSQPSYYVWRKKLKALDLATFTNPDESAESFKPVGPMSFEPVSFAPPRAHQPGLKVRLPGGIELEFGDDPNVIEAVSGNSSNRRCERASRRHVEPGQRNQNLCLHAGRGYAKRHQRSVGHCAGRVSVGSD